MSFSISFTASSISIARQKVHEAYAPAAVKALIEKALDALSHPVSSGVTQLAAGASKSAVADFASIDAHIGSSRSAAHGEAKAAPRPPRLFGVHVEAWGHIGDPGDHGTSWIDKFRVQPLFE